MHGRNPAPYALASSHFATNLQGYLMMKQWKKHFYTQLTSIAHDIIWAGRPLLKVKRKCPAQMMSCAIEVCCVFAEGKPRLQEMKSVHCVKRVYTVHCVQPISILTEFPHVSKTIPIGCFPTKRIQLFFFLMAELLHQRIQVFTICCQYFSM